MRASHFARALGAVLAVSVATLSPGAQRPGAHPGESKPDFDKLQKSFAENHCKQKDAACVFEDVLARDFLRLELGVFDVSYPRASLSSTENAQELIGLLVSLTDMQAR